MKQFVADSGAFSFINLEHLPWGRHAIVDCRGVSFKTLDDVKFLENTLRQSIQQAGAKLLAVDSKQFQPNGVTVCAILAESHVTIHTYPEFGVAMLDAFTCGKIDPRDIVVTAVSVLNPRHYKMDMFERGYRQSHQLANCNQD